MRSLSTLRLSPARPGTTYLVKRGHVLLAPTITIRALILCRPARHRLIAAHQCVGRGDLILELNHWLWLASARYEQPHAGILCLSMRAGMAQWEILDGCSVSTDLWSYVTVNAMHCI